MEATLLASFLNTYLPKIYAVITKGNAKEERLKHELEINKLEIELSMMAATIEDYESSGSGMERGTAESVWINTFRQLAQEIENHIELFLHPRASSSSSVACLTEDLIERLNSLKKDQRPLGAPATTSTSHVNQSVPFLRPYIVHKDEPLSELLQLVVQEDEELQEDAEEMKVVQEDEELQEDAEEMKVITIVGFGGLGKTLRANQVYQSKEVLDKKKFDLREWFCAEDMKGDDILKLIRERLEKNDANSGSDGTNNVQWIRTCLQDKRDMKSDDILKLIRERLEKTDANSGSDGTNNVQWIRTCLQDKRYLIVIDDMRDQMQWHHIKDAFPKKLSSRIIVTTTRESVANACSISSGGYVYRLLPLNKDDSLNLLANGLRSCDSEDAEDLLNKCDGLPLALIKLSQYFQGKGGLTRKTCEDACRSLGGFLVGNQELGEIQKVLEDKYTGLSGILKACLLYFSVFPWNNQTKRNYLIRRWVAEGFVSQDDPVDNFNTLMERNVIQAMEVSSDGVGKTCQPPGMMLEYILYKATSEKFVTLFPAVGETNGSAGATYVRRICLDPDNLEDDDLSSSIYLPLVRALEISGMASEAILNFTEGRDNYKLLRVLELKECATLEDKHVKNICKYMLLLRYLSLGEKIVRIPDEIKNLKLLETLHASRTEVVKVPYQLILLPSLTHLFGKFQFYGEDEYNKIPIKSRIKLERLSGFVAGEKGLPELMSRMECLRKVKLWGNHTADGTLLEAIKKFVRKGLDKQLKGDRSLSVDFSGCSTPFKDSDEYPGRLTSLKLKGKMMMEQFPRFLQLKGIEKLCLSSTGLTWVIIEEGVGQFPKLIYLKLHEDDLCAPAPEDDATNDAPSVERVKSFQKLQRICFSSKTLPPPTILQRRHYLPAIEQVYLYSIQTQDKETRCNQDWKVAARKHPQRPTVWFGAAPQASQ